MTKTVLILGGRGKIGSHATTAFARAGWTVRQFNRHADNMSHAAEGADVIVNGLNPPMYHNWKTLIPEITNQVIAAARSSGATVIVPGSIYNFGNQPGVFDENTEQKPHTRKGKIRVAMEKSYAESGVQVILLRAGNFIDPDGNGDFMSVGSLRNIRKGQFIHVGDPAAIQAYCYMPDWARAAVMLAERRHTLGQFNDIPFPGHAFTGATLKKQVEQHLGYALRAKRFPWGVMRLLSLVWELGREMSEMRYLYSMPHTISGTKFNQLLPDFQPTDLKTVLLAGVPADLNPDQRMRSRGHRVIML
ncbi:epimerase [Loktanella sp. S4079]|uniref:epimerase n=1 Tax=Loktanella sp. S4079 TaxID=579483 RepID=UPI0005F9F02F|nr:epimerase [Loktanella sp. S4079]KJZ21066.1 epimerase [Loktanella sp. S4079]